ncbi:MAG: DUF3011 domain-containing protein [Terriglobales bacterium]
MRTSLRFMLPLAAFLLAGSLAFGQNVINCSSNDMGYHTCQIGPNNGVRMIRQLSGNPCVQGETFGLNRDSIWVNNGCRADFEVFQNGNNNGYNRQGASNGDYDRDGDRDRDWHHHHQRESEYSNGQYPDNGNQPYYNGNGPYYGTGNNGYYGSYADEANAVNGHIVYTGHYDDGKSTCSSQPGQGVTFCQTGGELSRAELISENGQTPCVEGQTWGRIPNKGLWVAGGCSGKFKIHR